MNKEHDIADSVLDSYRQNLQTADDEFLYNYIKCLNGYNRIGTVKDPSVVIPYSQYGKNAFNYVKANVNSDNAASVNCWPMLTMWAEIYNYINDSILNDIATFASQYYYQYQQKDLYSFFIVINNSYSRHCHVAEWNSAIKEMKMVYESACQIQDTTIVLITEKKIGQAYLKDNKENEAEPWLLKSYRRFQSINGRDSNKAYGELLSDIAYMYNLQGKNELAYKYALESCNTNKLSFGENSFEYVNALGILSNCEIGLNMNESGIKHFEEGVDLLDKIPNMREIDKQAFRDKLKYLYIRMNIKKDMKSNDSILTENSIILKATKAFSQGNFQEAISDFKYLLDYYEAHFHSINVSNFVLVVSSLSNTYVSAGNYIEADNILNRAIELVKSNNSQSKQLRYLYQSKGLLYITINNVDMALSWYDMAKKMFDDNEKEGLPYAMLTSNLSLCYYQAGDLPMAKKLSDEAYTLCNRFYGEYGKDANDRLLLLNNIATIYTKLKDFSKGKELYEMVIKEANLKQHEGTKALAMMNLAEIYFQEKNLSKTEEFLAKILDWDAASYVRDMAQFDYLLVHCMTHNDNTISEIKNYNDAVLDNVSDVFAHFSEAERENYWTQKSQTLVALNNLAALNFYTSHAKTNAYDNALFTKNMHLNSGQLLNKVVKDCEQEIQKEFSLLQSLKQALSNKGTPKDSLNSYINRINLLEKQIVSSIPDFNNRIKGLFKKTADVQNMLSINDVAIEFVFLPQIKIPIEDSELQYGALILTKNSVEPILIPLCLEYELEDLFDVDNSTSQEFVDNLYSLKDTRLYKMLWASVEPYIHKGSTIYYSPTGFLSKVNMSIISNGSKRLQNMYNFHEVSTTSMIGEVKQQEAVKFETAVLFGDINYSEDVDMMEANSIKYKYSSSIPIMATRSLNRSTWDLLPGTKEELFSIKEQMEEKGIIVQTYSQNEANEESIKALNTKAPDIIHIATHGFYFSPENDVTSKFFSSLSSNTQKDLSLFYSGLLFAGANNAWTGKTFTNGVEDGIMTAYEVSQLDLRGNKLIVLSACNTGLGVVDNIDGVFGLQRALKKAGVGTILMSLWKVPDEETKQLMSSFYKYLLFGETPHKALSLAQKHLIEQGKSPFYWAGFILLD